MQLHNMRLGNVRRSLGVIGSRGEFNLDTVDAVDAVEEKYEDEYEGDL